MDTFLKTPPKCRLKDDGSLIDKAFYRSSKSYDDPYTEIEDKVGARFIVLLVDDINQICNIIKDSDVWDFDACKHFDIDKKNDPLLFTYQSVHYILRPKEEFNAGSVIIPVSTACEVQIRTLLQHAHAELTHDAIYKAKRAVQPKVHRTVAKCMALIETTDDFFTEVTHQLNYGPLEEHNILSKLDAMYESLTGKQPHTHKSSMVIWDTFEKTIDDTLFDNIERLVEQLGDSLPDAIKNGYTQNNLYQQSTVLFVCWMLKRKRKRLLSDWPLSRKILEPLANDLGVSILDE